MYGNIGANPLKSELQQLQTLHKNHEIWLSNILSLSFRMETYGIYPADNKKAALTHMVAALDTLVQEGGGFVADLQNIANRYSSVISNRTGWHNKFIVTELSEMTETLRHISREWNEMLDSREKLLSGGKHARLLFVVRDK